MIENRPFKVWDNINGAVIHGAFHSKGEPYYYVKDPSDAMSDRAMAGLDKIDQWQNRCSTDYLKAFVVSLKSVTTTKLDLSEVYKLINELDERINFAIPSSDIVWELMSVMFFDESESPSKYDPDYGREKIARWRSNGDVPDFFTIEPLMALFNLPDLSEKDLNSYMKVINQINRKHIEHLSELISSEPSNQGLSTLLSYQNTLLST